MQAHGGTLLATLVGRAEASEVHLLTEREVWTAPVGRRGLVVACEAGRVWVTMEGDPEDHVLEPGGRVHFTRPGLVAVQALCTSRVRVAQRATPAETPPLRAAAG